MGRFVVLFIVFILNVQLISANWWFLGLKYLNVTFVGTTSSNKNAKQNLFDNDLMLHNRVDGEDERASHYLEQNNEYDESKNDELFGVIIKNDTEIMFLNQYCDDTNIFTPVQRRLCNSNDKIAEIIAKAAAIAIDECQYQFKYRRWNCPIFNSTNVFGRLINTKSKERAFINAIGSAAIMYRVTQACSKGELSNCGCESQREKKYAEAKEQWQWSGCSDNVVFGHKFSTKFLDSQELNKNKKAAGEDSLMHLHNNEAGRRIILENMKQVCKCHGVSGSCTMKVCWKVLPEFRLVGDELMKRYDHAVPVRADKTKSHLKIRTRSLKTHLEKDDLVFTKNSLNFCKKNSMFGLNGTIGRKCILYSKFHRDISSNSTTQKKKDSCSYLCCGRGYRVQAIEIEEDCDCQFQWCCSVKCKKCKKRILEYYCK